MTVLVVLLRLAPPTPTAIHAPVDLLVASQAGGVAEVLPALATSVAIRHSSSRSSSLLILVVLGDGNAAFAGAAPAAAAVLLAQSIGAGFIVGVELDADLEVRRGLGQVLLSRCVVVQQLLHVGHLMFGQLRRRPEAHVTLWTRVELIPAHTLHDGGGGVRRQHGLLPLAFLVFSRDLQRVTEGGHVAAQGSIFGEAFALLVDKAVARQAGAVVKLFTADVARVDATLPMQPQVTPQHPAHKHTRPVKKKKKPWLWSSVPHIQTSGAMRPL